MKPGHCGCYVMRHFILTVFYFSQLSLKPPCKERRGVDSLLPGGGRHSGSSLSLHICPRWGLIGTVKQRLKFYPPSRTNSDNSLVEEMLHCYCYSQPRLYWHWQCSLFLRHPWKSHGKIMSYQKASKTQGKNLSLHPWSLEQFHTRLWCAAKMIRKSKVTVSSAHCQVSTFLRQVLKYANRNVKTLNLFHIHKTHTGIFIFSCGFPS